MQDSVINTTCVGVYLDYGAEKTPIRRTTFRNQSWASIADHNGKGNLFRNNSTGTGSGAVRNLPRPHPLVQLPMKAIPRGSGETECGDWAGELRKRGFPTFLARSSRFNAECLTNAGAEAL